MNKNILSVIVSWIISCIYFLSYSWSVQAATGAAGEETLQFKPYGRLKATAMYATEGLSSFSSNNLSAPTAAAYTSGLAYPDDLYSFQVAQSRLGVDMFYGKVFANFEGDFINFALSSPTTETRPRLRKAYVGYHLNEHHEFQMGQDWDTFSPLVPNVLDYVALGFNSGNTGFMRHQFKWRYKNSNWKSEVSVGLSGKNAMAEANAIEATTIPALAYLLEWKGLGFSSFYSQKDHAGYGKSQIYGLNVSYTGSLSAHVKVLAEIYTGQNMNDAALMGISHWVNDRDQREAGGYVSLTWDGSRWGNWTLNYGRAQILNSSSVGEYDYNTSTQQIVEDAILLNEVYRLYWTYPIENGLSLAAELSHYNTERNIATEGHHYDRGNSIELGLLFVF